LTDFRFTGTIYEYAASQRSGLPIISPFIPVSDMAKAALPYTWVQQIDEWDPSDPARHAWLSCSWEVDPGQGNVFDMTYMPGSTREPTMYHSSFAHLVENLNSEVTSQLSSSHVPVVTLAIDRVPVTWAGGGLAAVSYTCPTCFHFAAAGAEDFIDQFSVTDPQRAIEDIIIPYTQETIATLPIWYPATLEVLTPHQPYGDANVAARGALTLHPSNDINVMPILSSSDLIDPAEQDDGALPFFTLFPYAQQSWGGAEYDHPEYILFSRLPTCHDYAIARKGSSLSSSYVTIDARSVPIPVPKGASIRKSWSTQMATRYPFLLDSTPVTPLVPFGGVSWQVPDADGDPTFVAGPNVHVGPPSVALVDGQSALNNASQWTDLPVGVNPVASLTRIEPFTSIGRASLREIVKATHRSSTTWWIPIIYTYRIQSVRNPSSTLEDVWHTLPRFSLYFRFATSLLSAPKNSADEDHLAPYLMSYAPRPSEICWESVQTN